MSLMGMIVMLTGFGMTWFQYQLIGRPICSRPFQAGGFLFAASLVQRPSRLDGDKDGTPCEALCQ